jgi:hypothetical protein
MIRIFFILLLFTAAGCTNTEQSPSSASSDNDLDAVRNFLRAALDGKWSEANRYLVQDSVNIQIMQSAESQYEMKGLQEKRGFREANITIYDTRKISDSISVVHYSNTFKNKRDSLKVVYQEGQWLVDLKYSLLPSK